MRPICFGLPPVGRSVGQIPPPYIFIVGGGERETTLCTVSASSLSLSPSFSSFPPSTFGPFVRPTDRPALPRGPVRPSVRPPMQSRPVGERKREKDQGREKESETPGFDHPRSKFNIRDCAQRNLSAARRHIRISNVREKEREQIRYIRLCNIVSSFPAFQPS